MKYKSIMFALFITAHSYAACEGVTKSYPITDPGDGKEFIVTAKIYHPKLDIKVPAIFIMPPIVGETVLDRRLAERFCANGMAAYVLNAVKTIPTEEEIPNLRIHDDSYFRALTGIRTVLDTLKDDSSLNGRFGILGMSLGGMLAAYIAGSEPLISASVIIVGAGNVPGVLTKSDQELVKAQRDGRMKYFGRQDPTTIS